MKADKTAEITITNKKTAPPDPDPDEGKIGLIKKDDADGKVLADAVFGVYRASDDVKVCELKTDSKGRAETLLLPVGEYYLKELKAPDSYELSKEKYGVAVKADTTVEIIVTNKKTLIITPTPTPIPTPKPDPVPTPKPTLKPSDPVGELVLLKKAEQTGKPLADAVFGVYRASDGTKLAEITTNADGKAETSLSVGDYYLKELQAPYGYLLENTKIYFSVAKDSTVTVEVTNLRDETIPDTDMPIIEVPKTGESVPYANYIIGISLIALALTLGGVLAYKRKRVL